MPISAPKPNSPPSANWVEALCSTIAESTSRRNFSAAAVVLGDDRIGVVRAVALDMRDGRVDAVDHLRGDDGVEIFGRPVLLGRRLDARIDRARRRVAAHLAARIEQHGHQRRKMRRRRRRIDQQRLGGAAHAGAPHLGVEHDRLRPCRASARRVDVDVADAFEMGEHRHARFLLHARDQALAAARHDHVDGAVEAREHHPDRRAVARRHQLDRSLGQARLCAGRRRSAAWMARVGADSSPSRRAGSRHCRP